jgi:hypothetical protein
VSDRNLSQSERILEVLSDGLPKTTAQIHQLAGFSRLNSRVAEMRRRGFVITCEHIEGVPAGPHAQAYTLHAGADSTFGTAA